MRCIAGGGAGSDGETTNRGLARPRAQRTVGGEEQGEAMRKFFHVLFGEDPEYRRRIYWMLVGFAAILLFFALERWG